MKSEITTTFQLPAEVNNEETVLNCMNKAVTMIKKDIAMSYQNKLVDTKEKITIRIVVEYNKSK